MNRRKTHEHGFTLIELLVVVAIIAVLVSILLPALSTAREASRKAVCQSNQRGMVMVLRQYADMNNDMFPVPYGTDLSGTFHWWIESIYEEHLLGEVPPEQLRYSQGLWSCPSSRYIPMDNWGNPIQAGRGIGIAMNDGWADKENPDQSPNHPPWPPDEFWYSPIPMGRIENQTNTVLVSDEKVTWGIYTWRWYNEADGGSFVLRHGTGNNFGFVDGHVEFGEAEPWQLDLAYPFARPKKFKYHYDNY